MERFLESTRAYYPSQSMLGTSASDFPGVATGMPGVNFTSTFGPSQQNYTSNPFSMSPMFGTK